MNDLFVSLIIPNFNGEKYLSVCLSSILKSSYKNFEILIIDDGSTDKSVRVIKSFQKKDKRVELIKNSINIGAAASRNKAVRKAKGEIVVFLDNDTEVKKDFLSQLIKPILKDKKVGATQALLLDFENRDIIQMAGGRLMRETGWLLSFNHKDNYKKVKNDLKEKEIVAISAAFAVRKEIFNKIGGFDEKEAVTTEDLDFCWRVWIAGYKILLAPKAIVYHYTKKVEERSYLTYQKIYFHLAKNSFRSIIKNYEFKNVLRFLPWSIFINSARGLYIIFRDFSLSAIMGTVNALGWNIKFLNDTLRERKKVQSFRFLSDNFLFANIFDQRSFLQIYSEFFKSK